MTKDVEPAFPVENSPNFFSGMTLRDYFAGLAMQSLIAHPNGTAGQWSITARDAYMQADAMLETRKL